MVACHKITGLIRREELGEAWCLMSIEIRDQGQKGFGMVCWTKMDIITIVFTRNEM